MVFWHLTTLFEGTSVNRNYDTNVLSALRSCLPLLFRCSIISHPGNLLFSPGLHDVTFQTWQTSVQASHFLMADTSLHSLMSPTGPFCLDIWKALQLHHFLNSLPSTHNFNRHLTTLRSSTPYTFESLTTDCPVKQSGRLTWTLLLLWNNRSISLIYAKILNLYKSPENQL